jgi:hypothetical protein
MRKAWRPVSDSGAERLYGKDKVWMHVFTTDFIAGNPKMGEGLPTKQNIRSAFDEVRKTARAEDTLLGICGGTVRCRARIAICTTT